MYKRYPENTHNMQNHILYLQKWEILIKEQELEKNIVTLKML